MSNKNKLARGIYYVAYGKPAIQAALQSIESVGYSNPELPTCVVTDAPQDFADTPSHIVDYDSDRYGRKAKLRADLLSPFKHTLYLDADTRVNLSVDYIFQCLSDGWDFVVTLSEQQKANWLWHVDEKERETTEAIVGMTPLQFQGGVWAFRKSPAMRSFFSNWRKEYETALGTPDQAALTRAWHKKPIKTFLLGREWNGGAVIPHYYGNAKRKD